MIIKYLKTHIDICHRFFVSNITVFRKPFSIILSCTKAITIAVVQNKIILT